MSEALNTKQRTVRLESDDVHNQHQNTKHGRFITPWRSASHLGVVKDDYQDNQHLLVHMAPPTSLAYTGRVTM